MAVYEKPLSIGLDISVGGFMLIQCLFFDHILNWMDFLSRICIMLMCVLFAISSVLQNRLSDRAFCLFATAEVVLLIVGIAAGTISGNTYFR